MSILDVVLVTIAVAAAAPIFVFFLAITWPDRDEEA